MTDPKDDDLLKLPDPLATPPAPTGAFPFPPELIYFIGGATSSVIQHLIDERAKQQARAKIVLRDGEEASN